MSAYADGHWVPGLGWKSALPVAKITRKRPSRRGDEVKRCSHLHRSRGEAMRCAETWAAKENR